MVVFLMLVTLVWYNWNSNVKQAIKTLQSQMFFNYDSDVQFCCSIVRWKGMNGITKLMLNIRGFSMSKEWTEKYKQTPIITTRGEKKDTYTRPPLTSNGFVPVKLLSFNPLNATSATLTASALIQGGHPPMPKVKTSRFSKSYRGPHAPKARRPGRPLPPPPTELEIWVGQQTHERRRLQQENVF